ncbi:hypothetical protein VWY34_14835 [Phaeobacter sp. JH20_02]|uniref:hypothetical protein n=1 Tax=unclassified Phaeobacter TaxID=2621772 RepID=UPI003A8AF849
MALKPGTCQLCMKHRPLALSHAIPNALIRDIQRRNNGQTIVLTGSSPHHRRSNESGGDHLLCEHCESKLNTCFDAYGVRWINQARQQLDKSPRDVRREVDPQRMLGFIASVLWRAAISRNAVYSSMETDYGERMLLRRVFETQDDRYAFASMSVSNLIDSKNLFPPVALRDVVTPPTSWQTVSAGRRLRAFFFVANGLLLGLTMPPPSRGTGRKTFWAADTFKPRIRDQDIRKFPPIQHILALPVQRKKS